MPSASRLPLLSYRLRYKQLGLKLFLIASHCGLLKSKVTHNVIQMHFGVLPIRKQKIRKQEGNGKQKDGRKRNRKAAATSLPPYTAPTIARRCGRCAASGITHWIARGMGGRLSTPTTPSAPRSSAGSERTAGFRRCSTPCWIGWSPGCGKAAVGNGISGQVLRAGFTVHK